MCTIKVYYKGQYGFDGIATGFNLIVVILNE